MIAGIIDCGTNTFNLIIAQINADNSFSILLKDKRAVKLGQRGINSKIIAPEAFQRGLQALKEHKKTIETYNVDKTLAFATSAIRSSSNGKEFVEEVAKQVGMDINVISGEREAELIYKGVELAVGFSESNSLIMDVGGGSTEFIIANINQILWKQSFDIGVARLIEFFKPSNPIKEKEIDAIIKYLEESLKPLFAALNKYPCDSMIGCSGSFETFASIILHEQSKTEELENNYIFNLQDFKKLHNQLIASTEEERMQTPGLPESRVDSIVLASIYVDYLINKFNFKQLHLSLFAIKEGILSELLKSNKPD